MCQQLAHVICRHPDSPEFGQKDCGIKQHAQPPNLFVPGQYIVPMGGILVGSKYSQLRTPPRGIYTPQWGVGGAYKDLQMLSGLTHTHIHTYTHSYTHIQCVGSSLLEIVCRCGNRRRRRRRRTNVLVSSCSKTLVHLDNRRMRDTARRDVLNECKGVECDNQREQQCRAHVLVFSLLEHCEPRARRSKVDLDLCKQQFD